MNYNRKKKWLVIFLILNLVIVSLAKSTSIDVQATTSFTPRLSAPDKSNEYYYGNKNVFYANGWGMPNCTAYAYGRAYELLGTAPKVSTGNAGKWWTYNKEKGYYSYGSTPKLGAIAVWDKWDNNQGHVAVVEAINGDNVTISESHYGGVVFDTRTIKADSSNYLTSMRFNGYIYIGDFVQTNLPIGSVDGINTGYNTVTVSGWALDLDDPNRSVIIHVYVGDYLAGAGVADGYRPDINEVYGGVGEYHAYNIVCTVPAEYTGTQTVTVYAIDVETGINPAIGSNVNSTVNIPLSNDPIGSVDGINTGYNTVTVSGWALDLDDPNRSVTIHVYVGDYLAGTGIADGYRPDIDEVYGGVGEYHAYNIVCTVPAEYTGTQTVTVYAVDAETGRNLVIGSNANSTVNIPADNEKPVISNVVVKDIDESGYTVQCTVTDNVGVDRVQFPTWTTPEQDDIQDDWVNNPKASGVKSGSTYTYRVNISDHNNEKINYTTHIYAYDNCGNVSFTKINEYGYKVISVQYTVAYDANGGSGAPTVQKKVHGETLTLSTTKPTRSGYTFLGWSTSSTATNASYQSGGSYTGNSNITLYAVWQHVCANGHSYAYKLTTSPTISATGKLTGICSKCSGTTTVILPKLSTSDYTYKIVVAPTCTVAGTGRYTWNTTNYGSYYFDVAISKKGHSYNTEVVAPDCTEGGYTLHICDTCGESYEDSEVEALGHKLGEWTTTKEAGCEEAGIEKRSCERCDYFETKEIEAAGHAYEEVVIDPTCEEVGYTTYTCDVCGDSYENNEVEALGHKLGEWTTTKEASCTEAGEVKRTCARCDYFETKEIEAPGHAYEEEVTAPTCEETGYTTHTCDVCGDSYADSEVEALGHSFTNYISDNNASADFGGTMTAKCDRCDTTDTIPDSSAPIIPDVPVVPENDKVIRLSGVTRYETGYKVADVLKDQLGVDKFDAVVIATGKNFADALSGSYLAVVKNAPIILTNGKDDNIATLHDYIRENVAEGGKVYILGGEGAVPASAEAIEGFEVVRLSGATRYDTNLAILEEAGITGDELIVATGKSFADSLSASAAKLPILLVKPGVALSDEAKAIVEDVNKIYIIGGEGAVSEEIEDELAVYVEVERVFGKSRYETSVAVANTFFETVEEIVIASGKNFPDGLCGGPLAAAMDAPLILTADGKTGAAVDYAQEEAVDSGLVLGGTGAIGDASVVDILDLESADEIILK